MNYIEISKRIMSGENIHNLPLRVCYYARVSTESDVQINSLNNQLDYYENYIKNNPNWTYTNGYVDEGISGVSTEKRKSFKKMINDAKLNKFDLIITKEVSRFARDLEDSIHYIRELKNSNVGILFENQNLNTFDANSELILNIMFNLAQEESKKLSSRIKFGHREAIRKGHVLGSSNIIGYKKDNCKLVIIKEEAKFIKKVFELYATGEYGFNKLSKTLSTLGYFNKNGNLYDKDTLKRIIQNPKYKGYYRGQIYETLDYRTKKRKKISEDMQIIYKCTDNSIPPIVSEGLWEEANKILTTRTKNYQNNNFYSGGLKYPLSSKIYCQEHQTKFQRSHGNKSKTRPTWSCSLYLKYRLEACNSPIIAEKDLYNILSSLMHKIISNKKNIINNIFKIYTSIKENNEFDKDLELINNNIKLIESKKTMALDLVFNGDISKDILKEQFEKYEQEIKNLNLKKQETIKQIKYSTNKYNKEQLYSTIKEEINNGILNEFIRKFVNKIIISKINNNRHDIKLDIYLNLSNTEKSKTLEEKHELYLKKQKCNTIEKTRLKKEQNKFTYNVYINSLLN